MARFTVLWPKDVDDAFVERWVRSDSVGRSLLTRISHLIQLWLGNNPNNLGIPIGSESGLRAWILPLDSHVSVLYHVNEQDRIVTIVQLTIRT